TRCYRDWSSDVCSSDLPAPCRDRPGPRREAEEERDLVFEHLAGRLALPARAPGVLVRLAQGLLHGHEQGARGVGLELEIDGRQEIGRASCRGRGWRWEW